MHKYETRKFETKVDKKNTENRNESLVGRVLKFTTARIARR